MNEYTMNDIFGNVKWFSLSSRWDDDVRGKWATNGAFNNSTVKPLLLSQSCFPYHNWHHLLKLMFSPCFLPVFSLILSTLSLYPYYYYYYHYHFRLKLSTPTLFLYLHYYYYRHVSVGEMMVCPRSIRLMDSISNGLDAATTYDIIRWERQMFVCSNVIITW